MTIKAIHGSRFNFPDICKMPDKEVERLRTECERGTPQRKYYAGHLSGPVRYITGQSVHWDEKNSKRDSPLESGKDEIGTFEKLPDLKKHLEGIRNGRVLDIGSGRIGQSAHEIANKFPNCLVTGLDIVPAIKPNEKCDAMHGIVRGEASLLPFDDNKFHVVYSTSTFVYLSDKLNALKEMIRVARDRGIIMVQYAGEPPPMLESDPHTGRTMQLDAAKVLADVGIKAAQKTYTIHGVKNNVLSIRKRAGDYGRMERLPYAYSISTPHPTDGSVISFYERKKHD